MSTYLARFSTLVPYADIGRAGLTRAAWLGRLREIRIGEVRYGTRRWLREYGQSRLIIGLRIDTKREPPVGRPTP